MLMAMIENIYETMNLRITETVFELHLRKIYPTRNILSMRETETISGQECLDVQKKTDGSVNIIGEVATDPVASWMIQSAQVASKFTLFTHHAKTFPNLVTALRNSMLRAGVFKDEKTAEEQVVQVLNFDIHLLKDFKGRRYIERITECIPVEEKNEYTFDHRKEKTLEGKINKFFDNATIFFSKTTNRELYKYRNILEFSNDSYVLTNPISDVNIREMRNNMDDADVVRFDEFLERVWGIKPPESERDIKTNKAIASSLNNFNSNIDKQINKEQQNIDRPINKMSENIDRPIKKENIGMKKPNINMDKTINKINEKKDEIVNKIKQSEVNEQVKDMSNKIIKKTITMGKKIVNKEEEKKIDNLDDMLSNAINNNIDDDNE